jgi:hypothetical protein
MRKDRQRILHQSNAEGKETANEEFGGQGFG